MRQDRDSSVPQPMIEPLEARQLMALVVDVRLPGGGKEVVATSVGQTINLEVWATATGSDNNVSNEGLQTAIGSLLSANIGGGAVSGTLKATLVSPFNGNGSSSGAQVDLDGDGDLDVGSNTNDEAAGFLFARAADTSFDGTDVAKGQSFKIANATFTVTKLLTGTQTDLVYRIRPTTNAYLYVQDGQSASSLTGATFAAGTGVKVTVPGVATVSGRVFNDKNANGIFDGSDTGIGGFRVFLDKDADGQLDSNEISKPVSSTGTYTFTGVPTGTYRVREVFRDGWRQTFPALGYYEVTLRSGDAAKSLSFANTDTVLIKGNVFMDANQNKLRDAAEPGLRGWMLFLDHNNSGKLDKGDDWALSDANGNYRFFNLPAGKYVVRAVQQAGYKLTAPAGGAHTVTLGAGDTVSNKNFGEKRLK